MRLISIILSILFLAQITCYSQEIKSLKEYEYWDGLKKKKCTVYDTEGHLTGMLYYRQDGTIEKVERFDSAGHKTEEALYDQNKKLRPGIDGWAALRWWYDEDSQLRLQASYDENGKVMERKYYSTGGHLIFRQYRDDDNLNSYEQASMFMILGGKNVAYYDANERLEESIRLVNE